MRDPGVRRQSAGPLPAEPLEERDVAGLDVGVHAVSAAPCGLGDGEPHQRRAEAQVPGSGQHREPVSVPQSGRGQRVEPDRAADVVADEPDDVDRRRVGVVAVPVVAVPAGPQEKPLLSYEHLVPDPEAGRAFPLGAHRPAGERGGACRANRG
jgi:hypothetical protein